MTTAPSKSHLFARMSLFHSGSAFCCLLFHPSKRDESNCAPHCVFDLVDVFGAGSSVFDDAALKNELFEDVLQPPHGRRLVATIRRDLVVTLWLWC